MNWKDFCVRLLKCKTDEIDSLRKDSQEHGVYPGSINFYEEDPAWFFVFKEEKERFLAATGDSKTYLELEGIEEIYEGIKIKKCPMNPFNRDVLAKCFPFMDPVNHKGKDTTVGLGDRLGLASNGHIRLCSSKNVFPVLAQQSIRELNLTGRDYRGVLSDASWAVFTEGHKSGFGADGDHLKTYDEVKMALDCNFTMITLDCSEHIRNEVYDFDLEKIKAEYLIIDEKKRTDLEKKYMNRSFKITDDMNVAFPETEFMKIVLVYFEAIEFTQNIYRDVILKSSKKVDFEMSVDETLHETSVEAHYFVASELIDRDVEITSLAPRFCGEFQKGIDYLGNTELFEKVFSLHFKIAEHFGYKLSVHSGSDKFKVFPIVGKITGGRYHLKTAGTNWLEAMRVVAEKDPGLYRRIHKFAFSKLDEARKYYHIKGKEENVKDIDLLSDDELPGLFDKDDSRQIIHITYGLILKEKDGSNNFVFRGEIYDLLHKYEEDYAQALMNHIGKHLNYLGIV